MRTIIITSVYPIDIYGTFKHSTRMRKLTIINRKLHHHNTHHHEKSSFPLHRIYNFYKERFSHQAPSISEHFRPCHQKTNQYLWQKDTFSVIIFMSL